MRTRLLGILVLASVLPCFGQTFGDITGVVIDSAGGLVPGAVVR